MAEEKKAKKGKGRKEESKKVGFEANIEEGLVVGPARLKVRFRKEGVPALLKELGLENPMEAPRLEKVVVNMGLGEALANNKILESAVEQLAIITGQKPVITRARKSIANFKLAPGPGHRLRGDAARGPDVRVRGSPGERCAPARP